MLLSVVIITSLTCFGPQAQRGWRDEGALAPFFAQWPFCLFLFAFVIFHVKNQFADSRAALMPRFRRVHATVAAAAAFTVAVILPSIITVAAGWRSIGLTAISVLAFGSVLWLMLLHSAWIALLIAAAWFSTMTEPGRLCLQELVMGHFEPQAILLLILGLAVTVCGGIRLIRLNEDMPEYHTQIRWDPSTQNYTNRAAQSGKNRILPWFWDWLAERKMAALTRHAAQSPGSLWSRICRWQIGMCTGWSAWLIAFGTIAYIWILDQFFFSRVKGAIDGQPPTNFLFTFLLAFMPVLAAMAKWLLRARSLGRELMLPVQRAAYVRQLGLAGAASQLQVWCAMVSAAVLWWCVMAVQPPPWHAVVSMLAISALCQFWTFGVSVWMARYRSQGAYSLWMIAAMLPTQILGGLSNAAPAAFRGWAWPAGAVMALLGLLMTWDTYRRWLNVDFD
jgi:hypothetical protein